ncbi:hypothetical protein ACFSSA_00485 [Luteolibacter algae]|uniref:Flp pilus-assembly TadG-like N-terminal domain-containing protein n=1 Tax=Luteolibacter algae TaxID=454151 RepID=A0ABW5D351_9BACT
MKTSLHKKYPAGYVSLLVVVTMSLFMLLMMVFAYKRALNVQAVQADIQTQTDYREKEETILRSIVAITPNRAIGAMQDGSGADDGANSRSLRFVNIFREALIQSNAATSVSPELLESMDLADVYTGNTGDSRLNATGRMFKSILRNTGNVTSGLNRSADDLGEGFPPALNSDNTISDDDIYPLITDEKKYGALALASDPDLLDPDDDERYEKFNLLRYPQINFGYSRPGDPFVAKRNWWAFTMDLADHDDNVTRLARFRRQFVLSIYEIPSQLPISASSFMALGQHASGEAWDQNRVNIEGNIFAGRAQVEGDTALEGLASRRGFELDNNSTIGGQNFTGNPFEPGVRERFRLTEGDFFPVSLSSESGKAAFVPINRGEDYFDRFAHIPAVDTLSPTSWDDYSVGALQCKMQLDIKDAAPDGSITELRFSYYRNGRRQSLDIPVAAGVVSDLQEGYTRSVGENYSATFTTPVDLAYGENGHYYYIYNFTGTVRFDNSTFGDPIRGTYKYGYWRTHIPMPFEKKTLDHNLQPCIAIYPQRFRAYLAALGADGLDVNNSLVINVDYPGSSNLAPPQTASGHGAYRQESDYGLILQECSDLTDFSTGFSLVTNLRLYIGDDFNVTPATQIPDGYTPPTGRIYYPPCSLFSPEKRYGVSYAPYAVELSGQIGSVASENAVNPVHPLDATDVTGSIMEAERLRVNLSTISHPAELPPITMMNWLILLEERRAEFYGN